MAALASSGFAQKKPLDHSVYDGWKSIRGTVLTRDGKWLATVIAPQEGDTAGIIRSVTDGHTINLPRAAAIQFTRDGKYALATIAPGFEEARKARRDNVPVADQPKNALAIVELSSGKITTLDRVTSFTLPREDNGWIAYRPEPPKPTPPTPAAKPEEKKPDAEDQRGQGRRSGGAGAPGGPQGGRPGGPGGAAPAQRGATYVLRNIATGAEEKVEFVDATAWDKFGKLFFYSTVADKDGKGSAVEVRDLTNATKATIFGGVDKAKYPKLALTEDGSQIAFTTDKDDLKSKKPLLALYTTKVADKKPVLVPIPNAGDTINESGAPSFTPSTKRLIFQTSKKPGPDPAEVPADEKVSVDIWTYKDPQIMPQQLLQAAAMRSRGFDAIYDIASGKSIQIENEKLPSVQLGDRGDGAYGIAQPDSDYDVESTWMPGYADLLVVDLKTGGATKLLTHTTGSTSLSPDGKTLAVFIGDRKEWLAYDLANLAKGTVSLSAKIPYPIYNELTDTPEVPPAYGIAGWTKDGRVIVRDKFDLWLTDPKGVASPVNLTNGRGKDLMVTPVDLDPEERTVNVDNLPLLSINDRTKDGGIYWLKNGSVQKIFDRDRKYAIVAKAQDADTLVFTQMDTTEYPDLWLTNTKFENPVKITEANPQQKQYNWLKSELVTWTSSDGIPLQGILYKPEDFDYGKKYPMISYFYERNSETLHNYLAPAPSASTINIPLFVSQGYLVFVPDIPYKTGAPGLSALNAIVPGVNSIVSRGYVDPKRLGIQGQSWGGYQVGYLVTVTNMFAAAEAGAPVSDMFSAYGGVRYGSGVLRQMQYEHGQSRIGGTPWDSFTKYLDNSPVFHADSINTPLMIMSNDKDGAVPHTQGIEFYSAMRRLGKPCWMVVYNEEDHNLVQRKNRKDLSIRLSQFFDHFLKGAPMPVWMEKGVPGTEKGRTMGTELTKSGG